MRATSSSMLAVGIVVVLVAAMVGFFSFGLLGGSAVCTSGTCGTTSGVTTTGGYSIQGGNQTVVATFVSTMSTETSTPGTTSSSTTSTASASHSTSTATVTTQTPTSGGSYSYTPSSDVRVLSVAASTSQGQGGSYVSFSVQFQNTGGSDIYVQSGGGSSLSVSSISGPVTQQSQGPVCEIATAMEPVAPSANHTSFTPGCWSGYHYMLNQPGTVQVQLTLSWGAGATNSGNQGSITINAEFQLA